MRPKRSRFETEHQLLLSRATYGARPGDVDALVAQGTESWLDTQLQPERIKDPVVDAKLARFDNLELSNAELMKKYPRPTRAEREAMQKAREQTTLMRRRRGPQTILRDLSHAKLVRAVHSERQLQEVMTDFWFNHFNVYARKNRNTLLALPSYERDAIRPHALGSFHDLLLATAEHPAMLFYLDNWINTKDGFNPREALQALIRGKTRGKTAGMSGGRGRRRARPDEDDARTFGINENYARELMELHTLGVDGGYDQQDVIEVARAMTGWSVVGPQFGKIRERVARRGRNRVPAALRSLPDEGSFFFNQMAHDDREKTVLGARVNEDGAGGIDDGLAVLRLLSRHPSTARFVSTKLAKRFVADTPSDALVNEMSDTFSKTDGDIRAVLRTMFLTARFVEEGSATDNVKVKTPLELVVSAVRATGGDVDGPALAHFVAELGMPLYLCQPPTGYDEEASAWLSAGSVLTRIRFAGALASGSIPGVRLPEPRQDPSELALLFASPDFQRQ